MLDSQRLRAARVVLDIGVHLGKSRPAELVDLPGVGAGTWDYGSAWAFLRHNVAMGEGFLRFELDRYLGWPGQAPSYAVGQRLWEQTRDDALAAGSSLKDFHMRALRLGSAAQRRRGCGREPTAAAASRLLGAARQLKEGLRAPVPQGCPAGGSCQRPSAPRRP